MYRRQWNGERGGSESVMLKQNVVKLVLVLGLSLVMGFIPAMATAGGIITHGRTTSEKSLEQEENEQTESDDELRDSYIQNQIYLFVSMVMNSHESFASVGSDDDEGDSLAASPDDDTEAGGCQQFPVSSLSSLLGFAWLLRMRRKR